MNPLPDIGLGFMDNFNQLFQANSSLDVATAQKFKTPIGPPVVLALADLVVEGTHGSNFEKSKRLPKSQGVPL